jgi:DNA-binding NtrC family response regulator
MGCLGLSSYVGRNESLLSLLKKSVKDSAIRRDFDENRLITIALAVTGGRRKEAATLLNISLRTFYRRLSERMSDE